MILRVITLDRTPERYEAFQKNNPHVYATRFQAVDGQQQNLKALHESGLLHKNLNEPNRGNIGCALSHGMCWKDCQDNNEPMTIFEDDAIITPDFRHQSQAIINTLPSDWDFIYWGWNEDADLLVQLGSWSVGGSVEYMLRAYEQNVHGLPAHGHVAMPCKVAYGTMAYSISPKGVERIWPHVFPLTVALDCALQELLLKGIKIYVCVPALVRTSNDHSKSTIQR